MTVPAPTGKADIHLHSTFSDGLMSVEEILEWVQEKTDLDVIAVTDHDEIEGGLRARELAAGSGYRFEVVAGVEVSTREGHLLALFLDQPVRPFRPLQETIEEVRALGGLCIVPHPMSWLTTSVGERSLDRAMAHYVRGIVGLEVANPTVAGRVTRQKVIRLNRSRYALAETGGSDAHFLTSIGSAYTRFVGRTAEDLRRSLIEGTTAGIERNERLRSVPVRDLLRQQSRSMIWLPAKRMRRRLAERRNVRLA